MIAVGIHLQDNRAVLNGILLCKGTCLATAEGHSGWRNLSTRYTDTSASARHNLPFESTVSARLPETVWTGSLFHEVEELYLTHPSPEPAGLLELLTLPLGLHAEETGLAISLGVSLPKLSLNHPNHLKTCPPCGPSTLHCCPPGQANGVYTGLMQLCKSQPLASGLKRRWEQKTGEGAPHKGPSPAWWPAHPFRPP